MNTIKRNTDPLIGPPDGVEAGIQCVVTQFEQAKGNGNAKKARNRGIKAQSAMPCRALCAYSEGTISFSIRELDLMVTLRLDEIIEIIRAATDAARTLETSLPKKYKDAELEARWRELSDLPMVEADSPSGLILSNAWWIFPKGTDREDIWNYFEERHSKGVAYLNELQDAKPADGDGAEEHRR